jgi:Mg/Co/Ni transporter MgtE
MQYTTITDAERDKMIARDLHAAEMQHLQFELQVAREAQILETLPKDDWPKELDYLRGKGRDAIIALAKSPEDEAAALNLAYRDHLAIRRKAAVHECAKCAQAAAIFSAQLPKDPALRDACLLAEKTEREAQEAIVK